MDMDAMLAYNLTDNLFDYDAAKIAQMPVLMPADVSVDSRPKPSREGARRQDQSTPSPPGTVSKAVSFSLPCPKFWL
jgi:hypothetical protein